MCGADPIGRWRMNTRRITAVSMLVATWLCGCGQWGGLPEPTKKMVTAKDLVGTWTGNAFRPMKLNQSSNYSFQFDLRADGTFEQTISVSGDTNLVHQTGTWNILGGHIELNEALLEEFDFTKNIGIWKARQTIWDVLDGRGNTFVIFGGLFPDPDSWQELKRSANKDAVTVLRWTA